MVKSVDKCIGALRLLNVRLSHKLSLGTVFLETKNNNSEWKGLLGKKQTGVARALLESVGQAKKEHSYGVFLWVLSVQWSDYVLRFH